MMIKNTPQGYLIYAAMAAMLLAFIATVFRRKRTGQAIYAGSFLIVVAALIYRWVDVKHVPMQNLFEVFLCLGMIYPVSLFCRKFLRVGGDAADMLIGFIVLFPAGFVFNAEPQQLPPALQCWLFAPHVAVYMAAYAVMAKATVQAVACLIGKDRPLDEGLVSYEQGTYRIISMGFPLLTLGLILGSWWGKLAWGDYWGWDPKEMWSLASWLVYVIYFHVRSTYGVKQVKLNSIVAVAGMAVIIITLLWVNLSRIFAGGLHSYAS
jgi:ABC-type transport system involved in cytochrome c biogenesis permease subunit